MAGKGAFDSGEKGGEIAPWFGGEEEEEKDEKQHKGEKNDIDG